MNDISDNLTNKSIDCCIGKTRVRFGRWFTPIGSTSDQCTYCNFCYNNGCADKSTVYEVIPQKPNKYNSLLNCNCDCPNQSNHDLIVAIKCPQCNVEPNKIFFCSASYCNDCGIDIPYSADHLCDGCSYRTKSCYSCGLAIIDGNSYIKNVEDYINIRNDEINERLEQISIKRSKKCETNDEDRFDFEIRMLSNSKKHYLEYLSRIKNLYTNKSIEEMIKILIEEKRGQLIRRTNNNI